MGPDGTFSSETYDNTSASANDTLDLATVELFKGYPDGLMKFATACCILFMMIGIPGNLITIIALSCYKKVRNATALFIINLSCSDLILGCFNLSLTASTIWQRSWTHGQILCRILPFVRYTVLAVSLFTVLTITVNRYVMIAHPKLYPKIYKTRNIGIIIASIWIFSIVGFIPTWLGKYGRFGLDAKIGSCSVLPDEKGRSPKKAFIIIAFFLPCLALIFCYARIFFIVRKTTKKSLLTNKLAPKDDESSSSDISTQVIKIPTADPSCASVADKEESSVCSKGDTQRIIKFKVVTGEATKNRSESRSLKLRRTALRKSIALLKLSLPTRKDRRLGTMIIAIMISFCVCHIPITITKLFVKMSTNFTLCIVAYILMFLSSCLNPIIYVVMSHEYRKAYKHLLKRRHKASLPIRGNRR